MYQGFLNSPLNYKDPLGTDALSIAFVDYEIAVGDLRLPFLGHAAVVTIAGSPSRHQRLSTKYFEYGRYDAAQLGETRNRRISDLDVGPNGLPTRESLNALLHEISEQFGQGSRVRAAYFVTDDESTAQMNAYAQECIKRNSDPDREPYSIWSNNCGTFTEDVVEAGDVDLPIILAPHPNARVNAWQAKADFSIEYDPETGKLDVPEEFFTADKSEILRWKALPFWKRIFTRKPH